jgi:hypothetical protein
MFHGHLDYLQKPPLGRRPNTKPRDHGTPNTHKVHWFILFCHVWGLAWIEIHWNSIWSRARSHITSHYTWGSMTTLHDFGGVLGQPLDTFFWTLTNNYESNKQMPGDFLFFCFLFALKKIPQFCGHSVLLTSLQSSQPALHWIQGWHECSLLYSTAQSEVMWQLSIAFCSIIAEAPIPNHDPIANL